MNFCPDEFITRRWLARVYAIQNDGVVTADDGLHCTGRMAGVTKLELGNEMELALGYEVKKVNDDRSTRDDPNIKKQGACEQQHPPFGAQTVEDESGDGGAHFSRGVDVTKLELGNEGTGA